MSRQIPVGSSLHIVKGFNEELRSISPIRYQLLIAETTNINSLPFPSNRTVQQVRRKRELESS